MKPTGPSPIERAVLLQKWEHGKVDAEIHALTGQDSHKLVNGAGRIFFVVLGAAQADGLHHDEPDIRILRGAVNALHDQAEEPEVDETRRAGIIAGLRACQRLTPGLSRRSLAMAAWDLQQKLKRQDIQLSDFMALIQPEKKAS